MQVSIMQFRGIDRADFALENIVLVAGPNASGKTSICMAVAAALTGQAIPILRMNKDGKVSPALTKAEAGRMVRVGYDNGGVQITDGENKVSVVWPSAEVKGKGAPPSISIYAAGLMSVLDLPPKEQVRALADLIKAIPTPEEIRTAFLEVGMPDEHVTNIIDRIQINGWDSVADAAKLHGAKLKGQWEAYAGESYGSTKGDSWLPQEWDDTLTSLADETLANMQAAARQALETRLQNDAVNTAVLDEKRALAAKIPVLTNTILDHEKVVREAVKVADDAKDAMDAAIAKLPPEPGRVVESVAPPPPLACPHCSKPVLIERGTLVKPPKASAKKAVIEPTAEELEARGLLLQEIVTAKEKYKAEYLLLSGVVRTQEAILRDLQHALRTAQDAAAKVQEMEARPPADERPVDWFRSEIRIIEGRIEAKRQKEGADRAHAATKANQRYIDLLVPDGLRKRKLLNALADFNAKMAELCTTAGYKLVSVDEEMVIRYAGRNYYLLSASEQYRVRAIFQIAFAFSEGAPVVILDGADILDAGGRNGLFALLGKLEIIALVGMTLNKPDQMPNLRAHGLGEAYWVADGKIATGG